MTTSLNTGLHLEGDIFVSFKSFVGHLIEYYFKWLDQQVGDYAVTGNH